MVTKQQEASENGTDVAEATPEPKSLAFAQKGIRTGEDFANTMSALMSDLLLGSVKPEVGNAVCNAGGKLLKVVEMRLRYATEPKSESKPDLMLAEG